MLDANLKEYVYYLKITKNLSVNTIDSTKLINYTLIIL